MLIDNVINLVNINSLSRESFFGGGGGIFFDKFMNISVKTIGARKEPIFFNKYIDCGSLLDFRILNILPNKLKKLNISITRINLKIKHG